MCWPIGRLSITRGVRTWFSLGIALCLVVSAEGCGSDKAKQELAAARVEIKKEKLAARAAIKREQRASTDKLAATKQETADERQRYSDKKRQVSAEQGRLNRLKAQVSGARATFAQNTIPGTGTFVVGTDISPGTYRAGTQSGCYWARLSSLNTSDIIDNDNADGPVVVEILPSDKAFQTNGCSDFHKAG